MKTQNNKSLNLMKESEQQFSNIKSNKAITLVALIITIIILLILAGVTITQLTGNGLFEKAKLAKQKQKNAQENENSILLDYEQQIGNINGTRNNNPMKDFSISTTDIKGTQVTLNIEKTTDVIKSYVIYFDGEYKATTSNNVITITGLIGNHNYTVVIVAIDENYNAKKSSVTFTTEKVTYLYNNGTEGIQFTGGSNYSCTTEKRNNGLYLNCYDPNSSSTCNAWFNSVTFDATNYNILSVDFKELTSNNNGFTYFVGIFNSSGSCLKREKFSGEFTGTEQKTLTCDLSSINENVYAQIMIISAPLEYTDVANWGSANPYTGTATGLVTSVYLEV